MRKKVNIVLLVFALLVLNATFLHPQEFWLQIEKFSALARESWFGNLGAVKKLLSKGANINDLTSDWTPLMAAAWKGHADIANLLLAKGANVDVKNSRNYTALILAAKNNHAAIVQALLKHNPDTSVKDYDTAKTALIYAQEAGYAEIIRLIKLAAAPTGQTPLMFAVLDGDVNKVKELLKSKVNVNEKNAKGETALIIAAEQGQADIVNLLLEGGVDLKSQGVVALEKAMRVENYTYMPYKEIVFSLLKKGIDLKESSIMLEAVGKGAKGQDAVKDKTMIVKALLESGARADVRRSNNYTALMYAVGSGSNSENLEVVKALIDKGADVNVQVSNSGRTALILAVVVGNDIQIAKTLLDNGAKINVRDADLRFDTPVGRAAFLGNLDMLILLLQRGGDMNFKSADGATPLIRAVQGGKLNTAEFLVQKGASINEKDEKGFAPLHYAVKFDKDEVARSLVNPGGEKFIKEENIDDLVRLLVNHGADISIKDKDGFPPLYYAVKSGRYNLVQSLVNLGADTSIKDKDGFPLPFILKNSAGAIKVVNKPELNVAWEGPLFVGYGQKWLLPIECAALTKKEVDPQSVLTWTNALLKLTYGLITGDPVSVITADGKIVRQKLGNLSCIRGECKGDYIAVGFENEKEFGKQNNVIVAMGPSFLPSQKKMSIPYKLNSEMLPNCLAFAPIPNAQNVVKTTCQNWGLDAKKQLFLQILSQESPPNEVGWSPIHIHARVLKKKGESWSTRNWLFLGQTMSRSINPVGILNDLNNPSRILWRKEEGIAGPAKIAVFLTSLDQDGNLKNGREYTAGGQPCD